MRCHFARPKVYRHIPSNFALLKSSTCAPVGRNGSECLACSPDVYRIHSPQLPQHALGFRDTSQGEAIFCDKKVSPTRHTSRVEQLHPAAIAARPRRVATGIAIRPNQHGDPHAHLRIVFTW